MTRARPIRPLLAALALALPAACGAGNTPGPTTPVTVTVFAAASSTKTFAELGKRFEDREDGVRVRFSFGGSSALAQQIEAGAPADVFASAGAPEMEGLGAAALDPRAFATNRLEIAVPPGNPARITGLADLARKDVVLVVCDAEVPCGRAAESVARAGAVTLRPASREQSVTDVLGKVAMREADAGLVYVTDVQAAAGSVEGVRFGESAQAVTTYPIAVLRDARHPAEARRFVDFVLSDAGRELLADAGFGPP